MPKPKTPPPAPKMPSPKTPFNRTLHLRLDPMLVRDLDQIVAWMQSDPMLARLGAASDRGQAIRYAVVRCIANPPEHVEGRDR